MDTGAEVARKAYQELNDIQVSSCLQVHTYDLSQNSMRTPVLHLMQDWKVV